jgi:hypothetical protein
MQLTEMMIVLTLSSYSRKRGVRQIAAEPRQRTDCTFHIQRLGELRLHNLHVCLHKFGHPQRRNTLQATACDNAVRILLLLLLLY